MRKHLLILLMVVALFAITGCEEKEKEQTNTNEQTEKQENKEQNNTTNDINNKEDEESKIVVEEVINCDGCVFAYFSDEGDKAKRLGSTLSASEYTNDIRALKTSGGKQRHNFFVLVLSGNTISKAYSCILKDNKIYCIQGSTDGAYHTNNVGILNQIFGAANCKTLSDGHNYWCTDGSYNGNSKTTGYTALHYETSCTIYGEDSNTGKLICH